MVALSGGLDSSVLLVGMSCLAARGVLGVRAMHVDHGLHPDAGAWAARCAALCRRHGVSYESLRVTVENTGKGLEAAAREARYAALGARLQPGETLLTAHHADDQLETVLLRVVRGAGPRGLRGILPRRPLGHAQVARPLLGWTREELLAIAREWRLDWVDDPSNASVDFDRNLLRERVVPVLRERWGGGVALAATRLGTTMGDASEILDERADDDLASIGAQPRRLPLAGLRRLSPARQRNALLRSVRRVGLPVPDMRHVEALLRAIAVDADVERRVEWRGAEARLYRGALHWLEKPQPVRGRAVVTGCVSADAPWVWPDGILQLAPIAGPARTRAETENEAAALPNREAGAADVAGPERAATGPRGSAAAGLPESWAREGLEVRFRAGGERIRAVGDAHHRTLKYVYQTHGVVPWMRDRIPLLYRRGRLIAVGDLLLDDEAARARPAEARWRVRWLNGPAII